MAWAFCLELKTSKTSTIQEKILLAWDAVIHLPYNSQSSEKANSFSLRALTFSKTETPVLLQHIGSAQYEASRPKEAGAQQHYKPVS